MHENNRIIASLPFAGLVAIPQSRESRVRGVCLAIFEAVAVMNSGHCRARGFLYENPDGGRQSNLLKSAPIFRCRP